MAGPAMTAGLPGRAAAWMARVAGSCAHATTGPRLSVLIFHRVLPAPDPLFPGEIDAARFRRLMRLVSKGFCVLPLEQAVGLLALGRLPARALAITFDDGYADNHDIAAPILQEMGLPATVFVTSGCLDGGRMWNDCVIECLRRTSLSSVDLAFLDLPPAPLGRASERRAAIDRILPAVKYRHPTERRRLIGELHRACGRPCLPTDLMMTREQVRSLATMGLAIGAHTVNHPILQALDDAEAQREIGDGKAELERIIGRPVTLFAYPNGRPETDYGPRHVGLVRALGFAAAVTTAIGHNSPGADLFQLRRFSPWDDSDARWISRLAWSHAWSRTC